MKASPQYPFTLNFVVSYENFIRIYVKIRCVGKCFSKSYYIMTIDNVLDFVHVEFASNTTDFQKKSSGLVFGVPAIFIRP